MRNPLYSRKASTHLAPCTSCHLQRPFLNGNTPYPNSKRAAPCKAAHALQQLILILRTQGTVNSTVCLAPHYWDTRKQNVAQKNIC